jgi:hypothetical protein
MSSTIIALIIGVVAGMHIERKGLLLKLFGLKKKSDKK